MHRIFTHLLIAASTSSCNLPVRHPTFQLPIRILVCSANFVTLRTRRRKCEDPCSFFTTPGRRCSAPLRLRRPDLCSLIIVPRSRYDAPLGGWRPGPCPFNTTPGFRCSASLRGLRPNEFLMGFISIWVACFDAGLPNLTQPSSFNRAWDRLCWDDSKVFPSTQAEFSKWLILMEFLNAFSYCLLYMHH